MKMFRLSSKKSKYYSVGLIDKQGKIYTTISVPLSTIKEWEKKEIDLRVCNGKDNFKFKGAISYSIPENGLKIEYYKILNEIKERRKEK